MYPTGTEAWSLLYHHTGPCKLSFVLSSGEDEREDGCTDIYCRCIRHRGVARPMISLHARNNEKHTLDAMSFCSILPMKYAALRIVFFVQSVSLKLERRAEGWSLSGLLSTNGTEVNMQFKDVSY